MAAAKTIDIGVRTGAIVGSLVALNVLGLALFGRLDLTHDREFTLSKATISTLKDLKDPVTVRAYFTKDLPPPYVTNARYVKDLLEEYYAHSGGNFRYEFIDPAAEETSADKETKKEVKVDIFGRQVREQTSVEKELEGLGIPPVQVRVNQDDKIEVKRAYMGLSVAYGDKKEAIPVVQNTSGLEYDLTTLVRKVARSKTPKIGLVSGYDPQELQKNLGHTMGLLKQLYDVTPVDFSSNAKIPDGTDALLVISPKTPMSEAAQRAIDSFVMSDHAVAFLLDTIRPDLQTLQTQDMNHGLTDLLTAYGVTIGQGLVLDAECAGINVSQQQGFMRISQQVRYPFMPMVQKLDAMHPVTRGLGQLAFPFMSPLTVAVPAGSEVKADVLVQTSPKSWVETPPYNLDPMQRWTLDPSKELSPKNLVVTLTGPIKSHFTKSNDEQGMSANPPGASSQATKARVLVAGGASFATDPFMSKPNEALLLNMMDWLVLDDALLAVRSRGLSAAPIKELSDGARQSAKYVNIIGVPLAFVGLGVARWRRREARRGTVTL